MNAARTPKFLTTLRVEWGEDEKNARLLAPFGYYSAILGQEVWVEEGFETDFASVPRLPFIFLVLGNLGKRAAVIHDKLYRESGVSRAKADAVFSEALQASGMGAMRRGAMWTGLRIGGWRYYRARSSDPVAAEAMPKPGEAAVQSNDPSPGA